MRARASGIGAVREVLAQFPFQWQDIGGAAELEDVDRLLVLDNGREWYRWRRFTRLTLPLMAPFLVAGLRISYGICWKIALVAELFGAERGLGYLLLQAQSSANAALVIACCILIVIVFTATDRFVLRPLEARFSRNQTQVRG